MDNNIQKIPERIGWYFAEFVDGEGSFNVLLRKKPDYTIHWQICPSFNISQKNRAILALFKHHLNVGILSGEQMDCMHTNSESQNAKWYHYPIF